MRAAQPRLQATAALPLEVSGAMRKEWFWLATRQGQIRRCA